MHIPTHVHIRTCERLQTYRDPYSRFVLSMVLQQRACACSWMANRSTWPSCALTAIVSRPFVCTAIVYRPLCGGMYPPPHMHVSSSSRLSIDHFAEAQSNRTAEAQSNRSNASQQEQRVTTGQIISSSSVGIFKKLQQL